MSDYLQPKTLVPLVMAANMFATEETITNQNAPAVLITSWRVTERVVEVLSN